MYSKVRLEDFTQLFLDRPLSIEISSIRKHCKDDSKKFVSDRELRLFGEEVLFLLSLIKWALKKAL